MVILQRVSLVRRRNGGNSRSWHELASILTVCHSNSLKISIWPFLGSFRRVNLKSPIFHSGVFDCTTILKIWNMHNTIVMKHNNHMKINHVIAMKLSFILWTNVFTSCICHSGWKIVIMQLINKIKLKMLYITMYSKKARKNGLCWLCCKVPTK